MCARGQAGPELCCFAVFDIKRAYFHARVRRLTFIAIPKEDLEAGDEGCVGQFQFSLYGTHVTQPRTFLLSFGFQVGVRITVQIYA